MKTTKGDRRNSKTSSETTSTISRKEQECHHHLLPKNIHTLTNDHFIAYIFILNMKQVDKVIRKGDYYEM